MKDEEDIDLTNVNYEDVLHLYRGWRRSEGALKEKNKELGTLRTRVKQLQDSHVKFRGQIQALESVKEITISLQTQLSIVQQENVQLSKENRELAEAKRVADETVAEQARAEREQNKILRDIQVELSALRGRYADMSVSQKNLESFTADEQAKRMSAEARLQSCEEALDAARAENRTLRSKLDTSANRIAQYDQDLSNASDQLRNLTVELSNVQESTRRTTSAEAEISVMRGDIARLLRLLEHYPAARKFLIQWQDSQGMSFVGMKGNDTTAEEEFEMSYMRDSMGAFGADELGDDDDVEADWEASGLSPHELSRLKRLHGGGDLFPMTANIEDELELWVPKDAASSGIKFWSARLPNAPRSVIVDFLRNMNKVWLRRERRKLKRVRDVYTQSIGDMKRQLAHAKPYRGVIAERQIRRLKSQVLEGRKKVLNGRPKSKLDMVGDSFLQEYDSAEEEALLASLPPHHRRPCMVQKDKAGGSGYGHTSGTSYRNSPSKSSLQEISTQKLLEATLNSMESLGKQLNSSAANGSLRLSRSGGQRSRSSSPAPGSPSQREGAMQLPDFGSVGKAAHPTEAYLKGALWLGRNLTMVTEELWDDLDDYRSRYLVDIAQAAEDPDPKRSSNRLNLLAGSGMNQALILVNRSRGLAREILQGAAAIQPGDFNALKSFSRTLPIEVALSSSRPSSPHSKHNTSNISHISHISRNST